MIAIGNGTASQKTQKLVEKVRKIYHYFKFVIVDESGSSSYSVTPEAKKDNGEIDELYISALSLARRVSYPLSEYVKMKPSTIGIGQYQKDLDEKELEESFNMIISECVNKIGVDVNRASRKLLSYVSGIDDETTEKLFNYCSNMKIRSRKELKELIDPKIFKQCSGFLFFSIYY